MAGKKITAYRFQASTILEVLISMVVIVVVFGIAMMIYNNVITSSLSVKKLHAFAILNEQAVEAEKKSNLEEFDVNIDSLRITKKVIPYGQYNNLNEILFTAYDNQNEIASLMKIIYVPQ